MLWPPAVNMKSDLPANFFRPLDPRIDYPWATGLRTIGLLIPLSLILLYLMGIIGFPKYREYRNFLIAQMVRNLSPMQETWVQSLGQEESPGEGNGNPLLYSCLENSIVRGTWRAMGSRSLKESDMTKQLTHTHTMGIWIQGEDLCILTLGISCPSGYGEQLSRWKRENEW